MRAWAGVPGQSWRGHGAGTRERLPKTCVTVLGPHRPQTEGEGARRAHSPNPAALVDGSPGDTASRPGTGRRKPRGTETGKASARCRWEVGGPKARDVPSKWNPHVRHAGPVPRRSRSVSLGATGGTALSEALGRAWCVSWVQLSPPKRSPRTSEWDLIGHRVMVDPITSDEVTQGHGGPRIRRDWCPCDGRPGSEHAVFS